MHASNSNGSILFLKSNIQLNKALEQSGGELIAHHYFRVHEYPTLYGAR
jgi:hypothetical protein